MTISFIINDKNLLKEYTQRWKKVRNQLNVKFDSEPAFGDNGKYITEKIRICKDKVNTNFQS